MVYDIKWLLRVYILSFAFAAVEGLAQVLLYPMGINLFIKQIWGANIVRINGFTFEPSYYATYLLIGYVFISYLAEIQHMELFSLPRLRWFQSLTVAALILSMSRMGWLMIGCWWSFRFVARFKKMMSPNFFRKNSTLFLFQTLFIFLMIFKLPNFFRSHRFLMGGLGLMGTASHSVSDRLQGLMTCLRIFKESPLFGYSLGGVDPIIAQYRNIVYNGSNGSAMNVIGELLLASGVVGLFPLVLYGFQLLSSHMKLKRMGRQSANIQIALQYALLFELIILCMNQNILRPYLWMHIAICNANYIANTFFSQDCQADAEASDFADSKPF